LQQAEQNLWREFAHRGHEMDVASRAALHFLRQQVPTLPGYSRLHYAIYWQASELGDRELAARHLSWAVAFDPNNADLVALLGYQHLASGQAEQAVRLGNDFLAGQAEESGPVRVMLACALASPFAGRDPNQQQALEVLRPLLLEPRVDVHQRVAALVLSARFEYELGQEAEVFRLLKDLQGLEQTELTADVRATLDDLRRLLPPPNGTPQGPHPLPDQDRGQLFQKAIRFSINSVALAACG
jgi:hypothetical protein